MEMLGYEEECQATGGNLQLSVISRDSGVFDFVKHTKTTISVYSLVLLFLNAFSKRPFKGVDEEKYEIYWIVFKANYDEKLKTIIDDSIPY